MASARRHLSTAAASMRSSLASCSGSSFFRCSCAAFSLLSCPRCRPACACDAVLTGVHRPSHPKGRCQMIATPSPARSSPELHRSDTMRRTFRTGEKRPPRPVTTQRRTPLTCLEVQPPDHAVAPFIHHDRGLDLPRLLRSNSLASIPPQAWAVPRLMVAPTTLSDGPADRESHTDLTTARRPTGPGGLTRQASHCPPSSRGR